MPECAHIRNGISCDLWCGNSQSEVQYEQQMLMHYWHAVSKAGSADILHSVPYHHATEDIDVQVLHAVNKH